MTKTETTIRISIGLLSLATGYYFQWQAKRLKKKRWYAENSYKLGRLYRQIDRYENISKIIYFLSAVIICATFLL